MGNQNSNLGDVEERLKQNEDQIKHIDDTIDGVHKTVAIFEGRHVETVEKMKEVTVLTNNIQVQIKAQEQKMIEQSANDLNQIRDQLRDIENQAGLSDQKIQELDTGSQTLQEKVHGIENQVTDRLEVLVKSDASLLARINGLESNNDQNIHQLTINLEKKIIDSENKQHQSCKSGIQSLSEHLEDQIRVNNSTTERRLAEIDTGSQQLLEKLLEVEKEVEGKLSNNTSSLENRLNTLDADNKNNSLQIVNIQESINIQSEEVKKLDAERQESTNDLIKIKEQIKSL